MTGFFNTNNDRTNIENCVNMATLSFSGESTSKDVYLGGIAGEVSASNVASFTIKNCVNYGYVSSVAGIVKVKNAWQMMMSSETKHAFLLLFPLFSLFLFLFFLSSF